MTKASNLSTEGVVTEFYRKAANKSVVFIGDSLMLHFFHSVADLIHFEPINVLHPILLKMGLGQLILIETFANNVWNFSLTNVRHFVMEETGVCEKHKIHQLSWEMLQHLVNKNDIILFNMGFHYSGCPQKIFIQTLNRAAKLLRKAMTKNLGKQVILRSTLPQHFPGNDGYFLYSRIPQYKKLGCANSTAEREHESNDILKFVAEKYHFKYFDSFPIYMDRWDLHLAEKDCTHTCDCTHSCITAETTVPELALLNSLLD